MDGDFSMNRIPTLDGWRGIAIALCYASTFSLRHNSTIFIGLSGFLIISKLIEGPIASACHVLQIGIP
jgi:peptidoglycan/LPS O-acetylase OafA/YrhL